MIPKVIHYIWIGGNPLPKIAKKCIKSWQKYCPDYEIKRWDESNLNIDICPYCRQAYDAKKWAFASDVLRMDILAKEGGIYLDIDVELLKPLDEFLQYDLFTGFETEKSINPGLILGAQKNNKIINDIVNEYKSKEFIFTKNLRNQETVCTVFTNKLKTLGFTINNTSQQIENTKIFATEYFCPKSLQDGKLRKTFNTYSIHHYTATWVSKKDKFISKCKQFIKRILGKKNVEKLKRKKNEK